MEYKVQNLYVRFGSVEALRNVSLQGGSDFTAVLGHSGSGKTSLLRVLAGLCFPVSDRLYSFVQPVADFFGIHSKKVEVKGEIVVGGINVNLAMPYEVPVSYMPQRLGFHPHWSVADNVRFGRGDHMLGNKSADTDLLAALRAVKLSPDLLHRTSVHSLSGGEMQRLAMARMVFDVLGHQRGSRLLLFDEPLSHLDQNLQRQLRWEMQSVHQRYAGASIYVTHNFADVEQLADKVIVINEGRLEQVGTPSEVYRKPVSLNVLNLTGPANVLSGENGELIASRPAEVWLSPVPEAGYEVVSVRHLADRSRYQVVAKGQSDQVIESWSPVQFAPGERVVPDYRRTPLRFSSETGDKID